MRFGNLERRAVLVAEAARLGPQRHPHRCRRDAGPEAPSRQR